ncbi:hypothetical protein [Selenomonas ruminantium]|uniref:Uncharacterized protein n=1 Tax=Selenomonas ruminantium TaxID=971 RepID=A0A1H0SJW1_SELRU|nr:hypothetical protein [Selenomonas ruminantium]SDP42061.1 hypothetical protein SAMN05216366_11826 [Selenomonas ruminantium]
MTNEQQRLLASLRVIEALYEADSPDGGYATVVDTGKDTPIRLENCKVESVLEFLARLRGCSLKSLHDHRCQVTGRPYMHMDYYELSLLLLFMAVPYRSRINSNHGTMAYINNCRVVMAEPGSHGKAQVRFLSGKVLPVQLTVRRLQVKIERGRKLLYDNVFAARMEMKKLRVILQRLQRKERGGR